MKLSEQWLRTWVKTTATAKEIGDALTAGGLELESITRAGDDQWIELGITPNRGDCLSVQGIAREASALLEARFMPLAIEPVPATVNDTRRIVVKDAKACPLYCGRNIINVNASLPTPDWMAERLKSTGVKSVSLIVDIANYVMMELGQPLHAFDVAVITGELCIRQSHGETVTLLDGSTVTLDRNTCVVADDKKVLALAGVMGSQESGVTLTTTDIFLESAFFAPSAIRGRARRYKVTSDAATRFERGVDPLLAERALERATALILAHAGGEAGSMVRVEEGTLPLSPAIVLPMQLVKSRLGIDSDVNKIVGLLSRLDMDCAVNNQAISVIPPSFRFDLQIPEDLLEEVARVYGYNNIPETLPPIIAASTPSETTIPLKRLKELLVDRGYQEVITYSFVDEALHTALFPTITPITLLNPISPDMSVMRYSIWPGLIQTALYNQARQTLSMRIFEVGQCFDGAIPDVRFEERIAGLICGETAGYWQQEKPRPYDFYDVKGDIEALLAFSRKKITFLPMEHPVLAPGQSAAIMQGFHTIGIVGALHPRWVRELDLRGPVFMFELLRDPILQGTALRFAEVCKFPAIHRDLAIVVDSKLVADEILAKVREVGGGILTEVTIFDVYEGEHVEKGKKSVALGLILQHSSRTLIDEEVNTAMQAVIHGLKQAFGAIVRE
ncbi:MAG: phenylalanine--tRNA ligase subunit beta [Gammaproteobacteria bacterium]